MPSIARGSWQYLSPVRGRLRIEILRSGLVIALSCVAGAAAAQPEQPAKGRVYDEGCQQLVDGSVVCPEFTAEEQPAEPEAPRERRAKGAIAARAEEHVIAAEDALTIGDEAAAGLAIDLAWLYLESPLFKAWWRAAAASGDRLYGTVLAGRLEEAGRRRESMIVVPRLQAQHAGAMAAYRRALDARPPATAEFRAARDLAQQCANFDAAGTDPSWEVPDEATSVSKIKFVCAETAGEIGLDAARAREAWVARDAALRKVLKGERLEVYEQLGEPGGALARAAPEAVAKARVWEFVLGPTGKLKTYETWVITFSGNKVVERKRSTSHEDPP